MSFKVYIPARYASTRLPGKPLVEIATKPLIQHVFERAQDSGAAEVVVATDDARIADVATAFGASVCMTSPAHPSGTDRIAEAVRARGEAPDTVIVNLQGDEPSMPAAVIRQVAALVESGVADIGTVCEPVEDPADWRDPNVVKVVRGAHDRALYFSRAPIPYPREPADADEPFAGAPRRHVGLYAYRVEFLLRFVDLPQHDLERIERLEQLRALAHGISIVVPDAAEPCGIGIDTPDDLARFSAQCLPVGP